MPKQMLKIGDCRKVLQEIEPESIDCVVTSPPYYNMRDYGTEPIDWGDGYIGQLGLEPTPELYIQHLSDILGQVMKCLKPSGTCWIVLDDKYEGGQLVPVTSMLMTELYRRGHNMIGESIWKKPQCIVSGTRLRRFTKDYEKVIYLSKSGDYFFHPKFEPAKTHKGNKLIWSVWEVNTTTLDDGHYAPFPLDLIDRCISSTCPRYICVKCGEPRRPIIEVTYQKKVVPKPKKGNTSSDYLLEGAFQKRGGLNTREHGEFANYSIQGYTKCDCEADFEPGWVLDPFCGSGTVLEYSRLNGYNAIGIELNPDYEGLARKRAMMDIPQLDTFIEGAES